MIEEKPWFESKTIWGSLVAVAAALATALGVPIDGATQTELTNIIVQFVAAAGSLIAIYGRLSATHILS